MAPMSGESVRPVRSSRIARAGAAALLAALSLAVPPPASSARQDQTAGLQVTEYRIGARDLIEITVRGLPELNQTVRVAEDGSVTHSLLGRVEVAGLTAQELERKIADLLDKQYTKEARVTVFIREFQKIAILGAVGRPGMYEIVGPTTLLMAIAQAGGLTSQAMNELYVYRPAADGTQTRLTIRIEDLVSTGDPSVNIELKPKDVVTVPIDQTFNVFVYGEVRTPGVVPYLKSKGITLLQAIAQAGGTTEWAKKSGVTIKRKDRKTGKEIKIKVNLKRMINNAIADLALEEGDVVIIP
ncbi:MAG TPA: polysaccharide biosynthesis/export family protein [Candidatus Aminicenantes bacterium]|nr:polysaccharide biosynthesis/export family protein [Candidatus Aminicenantes bacterium]HRY64866.1 polysaccharide biosynthesis/export family protein [Candidatus Aminicenantes bacterium]HRZ71779.1 polysaccharide biosynthesis/export family protein [Candidatus Aminicenantes bacterium]